MDAHEQSGEVGTRMVYRCYHLTWSHCDKVDSRIALYKCYHTEVYVYTFDREINPGRLRMILGEVAQALPYRKPQLVVEEVYVYFAMLRRTAQLKLLILDQYTTLNAQLLFWPPLVSWGFKADNNPFSSTLNLAGHLYKAAPYPFELIVSSHLFSIWIRCVLAVRFGSFWYLLGSCKCPLHHRGMTKLWIM
jgi:hypothetical protein